MEKLIAGVDFSGSKEVPNETWIAFGRLGNLGLEIFDVKKVGSHALTKEIASHSNLAAVGIDCPFSVPVPFQEFLAQKAIRKDFQSWQEMAMHLVTMPLEDFITAARDFKKEPKRFTDTITKAPAQSPLHRGYPSMIQMTWHAMRLLASLDPSKYYVLPFQDELKEGCAVIEVYPRDLLKYFGIADSGYKGKDAKEADKLQAARKQMGTALLELREKKGITYKDCPRISFSGSVFSFIVQSDHALDAVLACCATGLWMSAPQLFDDPLSADKLEVLLEGWIYTPARV